MKVNVKAMAEYAEVFALKNVSLALCFQVRRKSTLVEHI
jgi:hypothetical protein